MAIAFNTSASTTGAGVEGHVGLTSSGTNRMLFAYIMGASAAGLISSVTCDGVAMTRINNTTAISGFAMVAYYIVGQAAGSNDIQFNWVVDTGFFYSMWAMAYTGANGIDGTGSGTAGGSGTQTVSVTTSLANSWIATSVFSAGATYVVPTGYANRVAEFSNLSGFSSTAADSNNILSTGAHSLTWTWNVGNGGVLAAGIAAAPPKANGLFMVSD